MLFASLTEFFAYALILLRVGVILFALPLFSEAAVSPMIRVAFAITITIFLKPLLKVEEHLNLDPSLYEVVSLVAKEVSIGLVLGFICHLMFEGIIMGASLSGYQMGFGTANLILPGTNMQVSSFVAFHRIISFLIFLSLDLHQVFIHGIYQSFLWIKPHEYLPLAPTGIYLLNATSQIFVIALQLASPILIALLFSMSALGLMARAVPQLNVFTLSFPINFFVGIFTYIALLAYYPSWYKNYFINFLNNFIEFIKL